VGSRKRHRAIEQALNKRLTFDLLRQLKWLGIMVPNDLKSCYDRICYLIASLYMRRQGAAVLEVVFTFTLIKNLEHEIRTVYSDSDKTYGGKLWVIPMQGVYQGNGGRPIIWAVVSSPLLQIIEEEGFGMFFKASITNDTIWLVGFAFVDNIDLIQTGTDSLESSLEVLQQMQEGINLWEGLVSATGGAIKVAKITWWLINFIWEDNGRWRYATKANIPAELFVKKCQWGPPSYPTPRNFRSICDARRPPWA
jgi:hypothetical protein